MFAEDQIIKVKSPIRANSVKSITKQTGFPKTDITVEISGLVSD